MHNPHYPYRADVDGLRALAVASVIAFHAFPTLAPGGFVGVDIFFVISGFLITGILGREIADSTFSIARFYGRRARRPFPALAVVLAAALVMGWAVLFADEYRRLGTHVAAGVAFVSNIAFWAETGYFDAESELKPLLDLSSLGVGEEFYIVWPLIIALTFRARLNFLALRGVGRTSPPRCVNYSTRGYDVAASPNVRTVVIGGHWLSMLKNRDYYDGEDARKHFLDFRTEQDLIQIFRRFEKDLARLRSLGKEVYVVLNPPGGDRADPGVIETGRIDATQKLREKSIPLTDHLRRTGAINERVSAAARRAGVAVIDPAGWLCHDDKCVFTDPQGIPYYRDSAHLRASFVRCCVRDFDHLVVVSGP